MRDSRRSSAAVDEFVDELGAGARWDMPRARSQTVREACTLARSRRRTTGYDGDSDETAGDHEGSRDELDGHRHFDHGSSARDGPGVDEGDSAQEVRMEQYRDSQPGGRDTHDGGEAGAVAPVPLERAHCAEHGHPGDVHHANRDENEHQRRLISQTRQPGQESQRDRRHSSVFGADREADRRGAG